jgi:hypothetical protein
VAEAAVRAAIERAEARMAEARPEAMFDVVYAAPTAEVEAARREYLAAEPDRPAPPARR